jgi:bifunctional DNase/RNase
MPKSSQNKEKFYKRLAIVLAAALVIAIVYIFYPQPLYSQVATITLPQLSTVGFVKANISVDLADQYTGNITLSANCYDMAGGVEASQVVSIYDALNNQSESRPNAHDLVRDVFTTLKIDVLMVKVTDIRESSFYAKIVLRQGNTVLNYDIRPSDGIAIALRMKAPIYVNETLLMQEGKKVC